MKRKNRKISYFFVFLKVIANFIGNKSSRRKDKFLTRIEEKIMKDNILLPATRDCMFKALMLKPELNGFLKELINIITGIPLDALEEIKVQNTEYTIANKNDKKMRSDVIVSIGNKYINIEMNKEYYRGVFNKNDAYISKIKASTYKESEDYIDAGQVIQINFNDFYHFKYKKDIYKFLFLEEETYELDEDSTVKYHVCLPNIWDRCYNKNISELTRFERFCLILKTEEKEYANKVAGDDEVMMSIVDEIAKLSVDDTMIGLYDAEIEEEKIRKTRLKGARLEGLEQGIKEGIAQGIKQGIEQGIEQGVKQGIEQEKKEIVKSLYHLNIPLESICKASKLSLKEVKDILNIK